MKRRSLIVFVAFCSFAASAFAQDVITLRNGDDIHALVQEIGADEVKYKRFDNPSGPNYTLKKSEILMITYANGSRDVFQQQGSAVDGDQQTIPQPRLSIQRNAFGGGYITDMSTGAMFMPKDLRRIMQTNPTALQVLNKGIRESNAGAWIALSGSIPMGIGAGLMLGDPTKKDDALPIFLTGVGMYTIGMVFVVTGRNKVFRAVDVYNDGLTANQKSMELKFGFTGNGFSLALRF